MDERFRHVVGARVAADEPVDLGRPRGGRGHILAPGTGGRERGEKDKGNGAATTVGTAAPNDSSAVITTPPDSTTDETTSDETTPQDTTPLTTVSSDEPLEGEIAGAPAGAAGTRDQPVPAGEVANIGGGWRLQVLAVTPDATAEVLAYNEFNEPPPAGSTFTMVKVALGYFGKDDPASAFMPTIIAVGSANIELPAECGSLPDSIDIFTSVFAGGVLIGNLCFVTSPADFPSLQIAAEGDFFQDRQVILATDAPASATPMVALSGPQPGAASTPARLDPTPIGTSQDVGDGWSVTVNSAARDITDAVMAENQFNDPPPAGFRFVGIDVTYSFNGEGSDSAFTVTTAAVTDSNVQLSFECGSIPNSLDEFSDVFAGGSVTGQLCFVVPEGSGPLVLYSAGGFDAETVTFASS